MKQFNFFNLFYFFCLLFCYGCSISSLYCWFFLLFIFLIYFYILPHPTPFFLLSFLSFFLSSTLFFFLSIPSLLSILCCQLKNCERMCVCMYVYVYVQYLYILWSLVYWYIKCMKLSYKLTSGWVGRSLRLYYPMPLILDQNYVVYLKSLVTTNCYAAVCS